MFTQSDYVSMFNAAKLTDDPRKLKILDYVTSVAMTNFSLYAAVQMNAKTVYNVSVPWPVVAALHYRESDQCFKKHLHNGDPLTARTVHVPVGRPEEGFPPFTWPESAVDAFRDVWCPPSWELARCLEFMERYNGLGYQKRGFNTPYLWDYTDKYSSGLFTADGNFDPNLREDRPGCVAFLKVLAAKGVSLDFSSLGTNGLAIH